MISERKDGVSVVLRVRAGGKKESLLLTHDFMRVEVRAPALEGRANDAVLKLLGKHFGCKVRLLRGEHDHRKVVLLEGETLASIGPALTPIREDIPDVRDGLTRVERLVLVELQRAQVEFNGRRVPSSVVYGRICEYDDVNLSPKQFETLLAKLAR